jgi:siroheme synthase-like protein
MPKNISDNALTFLPIGINISGKTLLIIGGGRVALHKAKILLRFTDNIKVVSQEFIEGFDSLPLTLLKQTYSAETLEGAFLVYACTDDSAVNARIRSDGAARGLLVSVCDNPKQCDFISPAIHREGHFTVAVSSDGRDVRRSIAIRDRIAAMLQKPDRSWRPVRFQRGTEREGTRRGSGGCAAGTVLY